MSLFNAAFAVACGVSACSLGYAQAVSLAQDRTETHTTGHLTVTSSSIQQDAPIPPKYSAYADGISPQIHWASTVGAKSYLLVVEDPDAKSAMPFLHWIAWNIPASATELPEGLQPSTMAGLVQGKNGSGTRGYMGPRPPLGDPPHHYHFQVFALDRTLDVPADADRDAVLHAANGHVVAKGELVATYQQPAR